jgi:biotin-(acetyl-CoA carboxylase) ligase
MTSSKIQDLLRKINFIEADIEIQKQILFSIPSEQQEDMEKTIKIIAAKKGDIADLRQQIEEIDPEEHQRIVVFENAIADFKKLAAEKSFQHIASRNVNEECALLLNDDSSVECLIKACDEDGDWTVITPEGEVQHFRKIDVAERPPEKQQYH